MAAKSGPGWGPFSGGTPQTRALAQWLRDLIDSRQLTLGQLAGPVLASKQTISRKLNGLRRPDWQFVKKLVSACAGPDGQTRTHLLDEARKLWESASPSDPASVMGAGSVGDALLDLAEDTARSAAALHTTAQRVVRSNERFATAQTEVQRTVFAALASDAEDHRILAEHTVSPTAGLADRITTDALDRLEARLETTERIQRDMQRRLDETQEQLAFAHSLLAKSEHLRQSADQKLELLATILKVPGFDRPLRNTPSNHEVDNPEPAGPDPLSEARAMLSRLPDGTEASTTPEDGRISRLSTFMADFLAWADNYLRDVKEELEVLAAHIADAKPGSIGSTVALADFGRRFAVLPTQQRLLARLWFPYAELAALRILATSRSTDIPRDALYEAELALQEFGLMNLLSLPDPVLRSVLAAHPSPAGLINAMDRARKIDLRRSGRSINEYLRAQSEPAADFSTAHEFAEARDRDMAVVLYMISDEVDISGFLRALVRAISELHALIHNMVNKDVTEVDLLGIPLRGIRWSANTRWPQCWAGVIRQRSTSLPGDIFVITAG